MENFDTFDAGDNDNCTLLFTAAAIFEVIL